jgi:surfeit locus 1 family protein
MAPLARRAMMPPVRITLAIGATLAGLAATLLLGEWQLRRAAEKVALEQAWDAAYRAAPLKLHAAPDLAAVAEQLPRRVRVRGYFEHEHTVWLENRALEGRAGFLVVTPLRLQDTPMRILVNRGWAPRDPSDRTHLAPIGQPRGPVEIEGMAVAGVPRVYQLGEGEAGPIRQNLDVEAMRAALGAPVASFVVEQSSPLDDMLDRRRHSPLSEVDRHRGYAFQWFALAALLGLILTGLAWRLMRGHRSAESSA